LELPLGEIKLFLIFIEANVLCSDSNSTQYLGYFLGMPLVFLTFVRLSK